VPAPRYEIQRVSFTVPVTSTNYAPERIVLFPLEDSAAGLLGVQVLIEATVAASTLEMWMLKAGGDPSLDASYFLSSNTVSGATAGSTYWPMISWPAIQLRAKSGGTSGSLIINAAAD